MTPKEKAWKLFWEMKQMPDKWKDEKVMQNYYAKYCALRTIDEIINEYQSMSDLESVLVVNNEITFVVDKLKYWQEVKQEINNL